MKKYTVSHEWIEVEETPQGTFIATIGISEYAQKELGQVMYVQLPALNDKVKEGQEVAVLESTKAAVDIYSPASGKVIALNTLLEKDPALINTSAEEKGWLFKVELDL